MSRILITGTTGQVGGAILSVLAGTGELLAPTRAELDLTDEASIRSYVQRTKPDWIINAAAYTAVDKAESEPQIAAAINAQAPRVLGEEATRLGASVIHFSTDYVFNGTSARPYGETDATAPINVYGRTKLAGEQTLSASGARHLILRTSWVYGATGKNFLRTILRVAAERTAEGVPLKIVADQHGAPTWSYDLARLTAHILETSPDLCTSGGIYHATAAGETTWHGFASTALEKLQEREPAKRFDQPVAITSSEFPTPALRPRSSRLDCTRLAETLQFSFPHWADSLDEVLSQLRVAP